MENTKVVVVGAGPVGSLAALYASSRGAAVEIYELRSGEPTLCLTILRADLTVAFIFHNTD